MSVASEPIPAPSGDRLPFATKLGYGLGNVAVMIGKQAPKQLSLPIYNVALGVNPAHVGTVLALSRVWDAVTDPLVGYWSDRLSSRWGRRRPFLLAGSFLTALFFAAMWLVPRDLDAAGYLAWFVVSSFLFYLALTIYSVPWYAMGYEIAPNYDERTRLMAFPSFFGPIAQIGVGWLYALTQLSLFSDTMQGVRWVGIGAGLCLLLFGLIPVFLVKERFTDSPLRGATTRTTPSAAPGFWDGLVAAANNRPFLQLTSAFTLIVIGTSMVNGMGFYVHAFYLFDGDTQATGIFNGWQATVMFISAAACAPLAARLSVRFGKKEVFLLGLAWGVARMGLLWFLLNPAIPYLALVNSVLFGFDNAIIFMLCHAMIADICDLDEWNHGLRREGLFGALYAWVFKTGIALSFAISGYLLVVIGFDRDLGGNQAAETLFFMKACYVGIPAGAFLLAFLILCRFPLSREVAEELRRKLAARRSGWGH